MPTSNPSPRMKRLGRRLFTLSLLVYLATAGGSLTTTDAVVTFDVTRSIVEHGSVAMSGNLLGRDAERGSDGRYYSPFGIGQSLVNLPFYVAAKAFIGATGVRVGKSDSLLKAAVALGETVIVAAIVQQFFYFAFEIVGDAGAAGWAALTLAFASLLWPYARFGFNQPLASLTLLMSSRHALVGMRQASSRHLIGSGLWLAASLMTRHEMAIAAAPIACWLWFDGARPIADRVWRLARFLPGIAAGVAAWLIYNFVRFGNPLDSGYLRDPAPGFGSPVTQGLAALLASPSASVFLYSPVALAGAAGLVTLFRRRDRSASLFSTAMILSFLVFYATLGNWIGGRSYGGRYLLAVLPYFGVGWAAVLAALARRRRALALVLVGGLGLAIQIPGVLVDYAKVSQAVEGGRPFTTEERQWQWDAAPIVMNAGALARALPDNAEYLTGRRSPPAVAPPSGDADQSFSQQFGFSLDLWWLYLFYLGVLSRWSVAGVIAGFAIAIALAARSVRRELRAPAA